MKKNKSKSTLIFSLLVILSIVFLSSCARNRYPRRYRRRSRGCGCPSFSYNIDNDSIIKDTYVIKV